MTDSLHVPPGVDPTVPAPARIYDYVLGGSLNFESDRAVAARLRETMPEVVDAAWANRGFHQRAARWLAQQGVRQFVDIGSGLPTVGNTHEVVQDVIPDARVVYVDNDPLVAAHSQDLLARASEQVFFRSHADVARFFTGLELVAPPGTLPAVVHVGAWGADDPALADSDGSHWSFGGVGRRPWPGED